LLYNYNDVAVKIIPLSVSYLFLGKKCTYPSQINAQFTMFYT